MLLHLVGYMEIDFSCDFTVGMSKTTGYNFQWNEVLHIAQDTEAPGQFCVVYECEDGAIWSRPYGMFVSEVDHVKHPNAKQKYRFELMESDKNETD